MTSRLRLSRWRPRLVSLFLCCKADGLGNAGKSGAGRNSSRAVAAKIGGSGLCSYYAFEAVLPRLVDVLGSCILHVARGETYLETNGFREEAGINVKLGGMAKIKKLNPLV